MTRPTVVFDTNVLVAELAFAEEPPVCVSLAESGAVETVVSPALLREFATVLAYDHLPLPVEQRPKATYRVVDFARVVDSAVRIDAAADPDDDAILECAVSGGADAVVSDDYHLRELDGFAGLEIVAREAFLDRYADTPTAERAHRNPEG